MNKKNDTESILDAINEKNYQWTKNQHYVPQFYLKQFTNENGLIEALDKKRKIMGTYSVKHICSGDYFYGVETGKKDTTSQILEKFFNETENEFANNYEAIVKNILNYNVKISENLLLKLSEFVAVTYLRGIYFKESFIKTSEDIGKKLMIHDYRARKYYTPDDPIIKDISENEKLEKQLLNGEFNIIENNIQYYKYMFNNIENYICYFNSKKKTFYISNGERNFITTDFGVSEITPEINSPYGVGFYEKIHYFPLSPKILVVYYSPLNKGKNNKRKQITKWETVYHNFLCGMYGNYLYSKSQEDFIEDEYTKARSMYVDELYNLFPSTFDKDKKLKDAVKSEANKRGITHKGFYDQRCDMQIWKNNSL